jgi:ankyrin repeat protein
MQSNREFSLREAADQGKASEVAQLLESGALIDDAGAKSGMTALHRAARKGHVRVVKYLVKKGANVNCQDINGNTPLHLVITANEVSFTTRITLADYLMKNKANPMILNSENRNSLIEYCSNIRDCLRGDAANLGESSRKVVIMMKVFIAEYAKANRQSAAINAKGMVVLFDDTNEALQYANNPDMIPTSGQMNINIYDAADPRKPNVAPHF